jgi:peptide deformylase
MVDDREGCLSFPDLYAKVRRAKKVRVQAYNLKGELYEMTCEDLPARVWQHEIDHLDGTLFIDKMGMLGRLNSKKALQEFIDDFNKAREKGELPKDMEPRF